MKKALILALILISIGGNAQSYKLEFVDENLNVSYMLGNDIFSPAFGITTSFDEIGITQTIDWNILKEKKCIPYIVLGGTSYFMYKQTGGLSWPYTFSLAVDYHIGLGTHINKKRNKFIEFKLAYKSHVWYEKINSEIMPIEKIGPTFGISYKF